MYISGFTGRNGRAMLSRSGALALGTRHNGKADVGAEGVGFTFHHARDGFFKI